MCNKLREFVPKQVCSFTKPSTMTCAPAANRICLYHEKTTSCDWEKAFETFGYVMRLVPKKSVRPLRGMQCEGINLCLRALTDNPMRASAMWEYHVNLGTKSRSQIYRGYYNCSLMTQSFLAAPPNASRNSDMWYTCMLIECRNAKLKGFAVKKRHISSM